MKAKTKISYQLTVNSFSIYCIHRLIRLSTEKMLEGDGNILCTNYTRKFLVPQFTRFLIFLTTEFYGSIIVVVFIVGTFTVKTNNCFCPMASMSFQESPRRLANRKFSFSCPNQPSEIANGFAGTFDDNHFHRP